MHLRQLGKHPEIGCGSLGRARIGSESAINLAVGMMAVGMIWTEIRVTMVKF